MVAVSPAFSATTLTKTKVKKIARKQINRLVPGINDAATIDQGAIPAVTMSNTDANKTVLTKGPFTISMDCYLSGGDVGLDVLVRTTETNSVVDDGYGNVAGDLDPADGDQYFQSFTGNPPGGESDVYYSTYYADAFFTAPSGTTFYADFLASVTTEAATASLPGTSSNWRNPAEQKGAARQRPPLLVGRYAIVTSLYGFPNLSARSLCWYICRACTILARADRSPSAGKREVADEKHP